MVRISALRISLALVVGFCLVPGLSRAEETLWESGDNLYIRIAPQDEPGVPNQHPVALDAREIANALNQIIVWDKKLLKEDEAETVFSLEQARTLGNSLAIGLQKAGPGEDVVFALSRRSSGFLVWDDLTFTAGRAFYANDRLNIIIGDYERAPDRFMERATASSGGGEIKYYFNHGQRDKASAFKKAIIFKNGIALRDAGGNMRADWLMIDVAAASAGYLADNQDPAVLEKQVNADVLRAEAAKLADERREMRLEMARLKKEMGTGARDDNAVPVEDRLKRLEELRQKDLITNEEYETKRKEILNDI